MIASSAGKIRSEAHLKDEPLPLDGRARQVTLANLIAASDCAPAAVVSVDRHRATAMVPPIIGVSFISPPSIMPTADVYAYTARPDVHTLSQGGSWTDATIAPPSPSTIRDVLIHMSCSFPFPSSAKNSSEQQSFRRFVVVPHHIGYGAVAKVAFHCLHFLISSQVGEDYAST